MSGDQGYRSCGKLSWHRQHTLSMQLLFWVSLPPLLNCPACICKWCYSVQYHCTAKKYELQCRVSDQSHSRPTKVPASGSASRSHLLEACIKKGVISKDKAVTPAVHSSTLSATTDAPPTLQGSRLWQHVSSCTLVKSLTNLVVRMQAELRTHNQCVTSVFKLVAPWTSPYRQFCAWPDMSALGGQAARTRPSKNNGNRNQSINKV